METNKISISEFVNKYKNAPNKAAKEKLSKSIVSNKYIPVLEKYAALYASFYKINWQDNGIIKFNSFSTYISYVITTLRLYTELDFDSAESTIEAYDLLKEADAIDTILLQIGESELTEINNIHSMILEDARENETNPYVYFSNQLKRFENIILSLGDPNVRENLSELFKSVGE